MSAASLRRAMMALPDSSTGTPSTRTLPFEPGANGMTVFSLRSIITQLLFHYTRVDERQSIQLYKSPPAQTHDAQRVVHKRQVSWTIESLLSVARMSQRSSSNVSQSCRPSNGPRSQTASILNRLRPYPTTIKLLRGDLQRPQTWAWAFSLLGSGRTSETN